jgi:hypothetical protein
MFPNVRNLVVAMVASVAALSCGFGVFAAFRVNHEPLSRLSSVTAPLQLVADNAAATPIVIVSGASPGPGFRLEAAQVRVAVPDGTEVEREPRDVPVNPAAVAPGSKPKAGASARHPTDSEPVSTPMAADSAPTTRPAQDLAPRAAAPDAKIAAIVAIPPAQPPAPHVLPPALPRKAKFGAPADGAPAQMPVSIVRAAGAGRDAKQSEAVGKNREPAAAKAVSMAARVAAIESVASPVPPAGQAGKETKIAPEPAKPIELKHRAKAIATHAVERGAKKTAAKARRKTSRKAINRRRRRAKLARRRRTPARPTAPFNDQSYAYQPNFQFAFPQPNFRSAPDAFRRQSARSRGTATQTAAFGRSFVLPPR